MSIRTLTLLAAASWMVVVAGVACGPRSVPSTDLDADADTDADADADADTDSDTDADTDPTENCTQPPNFGSWFGAINVPTTSTPYANDAGVAALIAQMPASDDSAVTVNHPIQGAIVTNVGFATSPDTDLSFWFADGTGHLSSAFFVDIGMDASLVQPGDEVAFVVTSIDRYGGLPQVEALTNFTIISSGNPVYVRDDGMTAPLDFATMGQQNVHLWGEITSEIGPCGTNNTCWEYTYAGSTIEFRIQDAAGTLVGDCIEYVGPLGVFAGTLQLNVDNFDWRQFY